MQHYRIRLLLRVFGVEPNAGRRMQKLGFGYPASDEMREAGLFGGGVSVLRRSERAKKWMQRQEKKRGKPKALGMLAAKLGRAVYHVLTKTALLEQLVRRWVTTTLSPGEGGLDAG